MAKKSLLNPQNLIDQASNRVFEGFKVNFSDSRADESFETLIENGYVSSIDLSGFENLSGAGPDVSNFLEDTRAAVFANGQKLFETNFMNADFRFGGSGGRFRIDAPDREIFDTSKFEGIETVEDLAEAVDISKISFKPVQDTVNRVETKPVDSTPDNQNNSMMPELDLKTGGLVLAAGVLGLALLEGDS